MLEVREYEIARRKLSGGTAQLRTLEGTLLTNQKNVLTFPDSVGTLPIALLVVHTKHEQDTGKAKNGIRFKAQKHGPTLSENEQA